jgi:hypothetical protein
MLAWDVTLKNGGFAHIRRSAEKQNAQILRVLKRFEVYSGVGAIENCSRATETVSKQLISVEFNSHHQ